jgi:sugar-specific transcriptional regulator TrmB
MMPDMTLNKDQIRLLGLSHKEILVLKALAKGPFLISQIVKQSHLPRMTIYPILQSLIRRKLIVPAR